MPHSDNLGKPCDIGFWALFLEPTPGVRWGRGSSDPRGSNEGGHLTPGVDPYREVSRTGPVEGAGSLPVPPGAHTRGAPPRGLGPVGPAGLDWPPGSPSKGTLCCRHLGTGVPRGAFGPAA